jgi:hypothetical protein
MKKNLKFNQVNSKPINNTALSSSQVSNSQIPTYKYSSKPIIHQAPSYQTSQPIPQSEYFDKNTQMKSSKQKAR